MTHDEIKEKVISLCSEIFQNSGVDVDILEYVDFADDLEMDSLMFISLIVEIEDAFKFTVPNDLLLMDNFKNANDITSLIHNELNKAEEVCDKQT